MASETKDKRTLLSTGIEHGVESLMQRVLPHHTFGDSHLSATINVAGSGKIEAGEHLITRWRDDRLVVDDGIFTFCRDVDSPHRFWSLGFHPTTIQPQAYRCRFLDCGVEIERLDDGIHSRLRLFILPNTTSIVADCTLTNVGTATRTLEVTSYQELILQSREAHESHPAFSKLFVETMWLPQEHAIGARRRARDGHTSYPELFHFISNHDSGVSEPIEFDSCRTSFIGRGRTLRNPIAMTAQKPLAGRHGIVLDPIASLRAIVQLAPAESKSITFVTSIASNQDAWGDLRHQFDQSAIETYFDSLPVSDHLLTPRNASQDDQPVGTRSETMRASPSLQARSSGKGDSGARPISPPSSSGIGESTTQSTLQFPNGIGGFSADGHEYVIDLRQDKDGELCLPPLPWCNVVANEQIGFIISESGSTCTWAGNSRQHRLTPWHNDPVSDPSGEVTWLRDDQSSQCREGVDYWTLTPRPAPHGGSYRVRHGFGYTVFEHCHQEIDHHCTTFVPRDGSCRVTHTRLTNRSAQTRQLSLFTVQEWLLGDTKWIARHAVDSRWNPDAGAVTATRRELDGFSGGISFSAVYLAGSGEPETPSAVWTDGLDFFGGNSSAPAMVTKSTSQPLTGDTEAEDDASNVPIAAIQTKLTLGPGESVDIIQLLGHAASTEEIVRFREQFRDGAKIETALQEVASYWDDLLGRLQINTPSHELNLLTNGWLVYQNLSCRIWGRSSFYQGGGAFGFRDQLQDASAFMLQDPQTTRQQILLHAAHQFVEGDVMHWWHTPTDLGIRTRFADDLLWLPLIASEYVRATGDRAIWNIEIPFVTGRQLADGEDEILLTPTASGTSATLLEHCCRAIERSLPTGAHGLPLMGSGDWNDGMNRIGRCGIGESVWMGFFLYRVLDLFVPMLVSHGDETRADRYSEFKGALRDSLDENAWDGQWYLRAFHDDGTVIGSHASEECQIDALVQAWSVISRAGDLEKQKQAVESVRQRLVDESAGIIRLLTPPFHDAPVDPGYIKGYLPGLRENGGQYTHGVLWYLRAMAMLGEGELATRWMEMLTPIRHGSSPDGTAIYQTEPYVVAADVYSVAPHVGRGGWSWYTGSAGWMFRIIVEDLIGLTIENGKYLRLDPRVPRQWDDFDVRFISPHDSTTYEIHVANREGQQRGVRAATLDGQPVDVVNGVARWRMPADGGIHRVEVEM